MVKNTPTIRFAGYTDAWEQRKLGECLSEITYGFTNPMSDTENGPWKITAKDIVDGKIDFSSARHTSIIEYDGLTDKSKPIIGDLLLTKDGTLGRTAIVNAENICINQSVALLRFNEKCSAQYAKTLLDTPMCQKQMLDDAGGGTIKHIYITKVDKMFIPIPSKKEQERLVSFFDNLDNLITLHQRKYDGLQLLKKSMLQKMFPQDGETKPEIRFAGFTDAWEQRKLSDCAGFRRGSFPQPYGNKEWYGGEEAMPFVQVADVADDMKLVNNTKQKISRLAQPMSVHADKGSVLVTLQGSIGRVAITQYGAFVDRTVLIFDKYNQDIDKTFWAYIIKEKFIVEARKAPGGTIKTITKEALSDFDLMLPNYDEQKKLGAFLVCIDNLITLHQRKLEQLKNVKKALLQNMFI